MSGNRFLLDTNAVIALLKGHQPVLELIQEAEWLAISVVTQLEFLSFPSLSQTDEQLFESFVARIDTVGLSGQDTKLLEQIISLRKTKKLKLPDAIVAASAMQHYATLITADGSFETIKGLRILDF